MKASEAKTRRKGLFGLFMRDRKGVAALEFAMLAAPFFILFFAIVELCISVATWQLLNNAADDVARILRTGQIKAADLDEEELRTMICDRMQFLVGNNCPPEQLIVDLKQYDTFALAAAAKMRVRNGEVVIEDRGFDPGPSQSKNKMRIVYKWSTLTGFMKSRLFNLNDGTTSLFAAVTWQNEPFDD
ncbi:TadE/TadG family type IV pilus assembly protein [Nitratireductor thuwali]|uniref:TadE-like domain-containing protein n=1 Tax=Nitratireductor thuwali TaxID=2267699 RepID=A0ABY5MKX8_9HYPH|nr:hypothetical protein NTH_02198 [Nitratireductor thuwali]